MSNTPPMRVLIVGGGAAGMSAAYAFSQHPERFDVTLYERSSSAGGMATSISIDKSKYGADYINDGVQGATPVYHNTYALLEKLGTGFTPSDVGVQVSFGNDAETDFWSNVFPSQVIDKFSADIKKFGKVLKVIKSLEPLFAVISVSAMLRIFRFSKEFGEIIVFPLAALFFGTGNQTPFISCAILERVFMDPNMCLFEYSPASFLASIPTMSVFPRFSLLFEAWKSLVETQSRGAVRIITNREVTRVVRHSKAKTGGVEAWSRPTRGTDNHQVVVDPGEEIAETFDKLVVCTDASAALKLLGDGATWLERRILGNVKYFWDVTVTHNDLAYMQKYYRLQYDPSLRSRQDHDNPDKKRQFEFAEKHFTPIYFIRTHPSDRRKVEMSFDLTRYQPQFSSTSMLIHSDKKDGSSETTRPETSQSATPLDQHVFQTVFLDNSPTSSALWSKDEINPEKIITQKWWKQQSHRWQHYAGTVPWMGLINGKNHTHFAGAWTILNIYEIAIVSGFGAAYRLGAAYPFVTDPKCKRLFSLCPAANHMARMRPEDRDSRFA